MATNPAQTERFTAQAALTPPAALSPYDVLKCAALLLMLCDHIGAYLFPDQIFLRVIGRFCVPIWLLLIGYARSRRIDTPLVTAALFISLMQYLTIGTLSGLNILWSIIILRLTLNPLMRLIGHSDTRLYLVTFSLFPLALVTRGILEYGTMIWLFGIWGFLLRNGFPDNKGRDRPDIKLLYGVLTLILYAVVETISMKFHTIHSVFLVAGLIPVWFALNFFLPSGRMTGHSLPAGLRALCGFWARHTLAFYVLHLSLLMLVFAVLCPCIKGCCCLPFGIDPALLLH